VNYIYTDWVAKVHPDVPVLREHLEGYFQKFISTESQRKKQRRVDNGLCTGYFWTHVEPERFIVLGELVAWVNFFGPFCCPPLTETPVLFLGRRN
jgi:hypothetical protein